MVQGNRRLKALARDYAQNTGCTYAAALAHVKAQDKFLARVASASSGPRVRSSMMYRVWSGAEGSRIVFSPQADVQHLQTDISPSDQDAAGQVMMLCDLTKKGKTTKAIEFHSDALLNGKNVTVWLSDPYEERWAAEVEQQANRILPEDADSGTVAFIEGNLYLDTMIEEIDRSVKASNSSLIIIDSLDALEEKDRTRNGDKKVEIAFTKLLDYAKENGVTILVLVTAQPPHETSFTTNFEGWDALLAKLPREWVEAGQEKGIAPSLNVVLNTGNNDSVTVKVSIIEASAYELGSQHLDLIGDEECSGMFRKPLTGPLGSKDAAVAVVGKGVLAYSEVISFHGKPIADSVSLVAKTAMDALASLRNETFHSKLGPRKYNTVLTATSRQYPEDSGLFRSAHDFMYENWDGKEEGSYVETVNPPNGVAVRESWEKFEKSLNTEWFTSDTNYENYKGIYYFNGAFDVSLRDGLPTERRQRLGVFGGHPVHLVHYTGRSKVISKVLDPKDFPDLESFTVAVSELCDSAHKDMNNGKIYPTGMQEIPFQRME